MKQCPTCNRVENDDTLVFCRVDGTALVNDSSTLSSEAGTVQLGSGSIPTEASTSILRNTTAPSMNRSTGPTTVLTAQQVGSTNALPTTKRRRTGAIVVIVTAVVAATAAVLVNFYLTKKSSNPIASIAVMPFVNKSNDPNSEYLSDGLAESLIYRLSQLPDLRVSPTSSVFRYKGKDIDVGKVGSELGVDAVMTGRLAQIGNNLQISVELVDVRKNKLLWGEHYERTLSELLTTQRDIAAEITNKLQLKLSGDSERKLNKKYTDNSEAYQLYLKGRYHYSKRTKDDIFKGIGFFRDAIQLDPNFALAYASIAESFNSLVKNPDISPKEGIPQAKAAAIKALEIDPMLAQAHAALADSIAIFDWNWKESEREFKRAIELDPNVAYTHLAYASSCLVAIGRTDEAVAELKRAVELEPVSLIDNVVLAQVYLYARQNEKALEQAKKSYDLDPNFRFGSSWLGQSYINNGKYDEAIALAEKVLQTSPSAQDILGVAGQAHAKSGHRREAEQYIQRLRELAKTQYIRSYYVATIYAALGDKEKAFAELGNSIAERDWYSPRMKVDPLLESLRDDARFKEMLKRLNLPE